MYIYFTSFKKVCKLVWNQLNESEGNIINIGQNFLKQLHLQNMIVIKIKMWQPRNQVNDNNYL